jgi:hypothetical protein
VAGIEKAINYLFIAATDAIGKEGSASSGILQIINGGRRIG